MTHHEAVLGGARWRLTLHPDGRWDVARRAGLIWDDVFAGTQGVQGVRDGARDLQSFARVFPDLIGTNPAGASVLAALADVAERSTTP